MANILNLLSEETFAEKMDNLTIAIHSIGTTGGETHRFANWRQIQQIVRAGLAPKVFSIGQEIEVDKETAMTINASNSSLSVSVNDEAFIDKIGAVENRDYEFIYDGAAWKLHGTEEAQLAEYGITLSGSAQQDDKIIVHEAADKIIFQIMGFDQETLADGELKHSMTLAMEYTFTSGVFSPKQAFYYAPDGLTAGTYHFKVSQHSWVSGDVNKTIQFTLAQNLPAGGQLVFNQAYNATLVGATISAYASATATSVTETATMTEGAAGTDLGTISNAISGSLNSMQRALIGNNRWSQSAVRNWANSNAKQGSVYKPMNDWDRPSYANIAGFLYELDPSLKAVMAECAKDTELNTVSDGGGHETTNDLVWLLSRYEIQSCSQSEAEAYKPYEYWHRRLGDAYGDWRTDTRFIKTNKAGSAQYWWLRSPYVGFAYYSRGVNASGSVNISGASNGGGIVLALAIA